VTRVASLGMYDCPWLAKTNDALWATLRGELRAAGVVNVPESLDHQRPLRAIWRDPTLLLAQTCGYPLLTDFSGALRLVATPVYEFAGCDGALHRSFVIVREEEPATSLSGLRGSRCAINGRDSNTGMNLLRTLVAPHAGGRPFFAAVLETGSHLESLRAVRESRADLAAIDCVTHGLTARHRPELLEGTRVLTMTDSTPGLPFVTAPGTERSEIDALRAALAMAAHSPAATLLGLIDVVVLDLDSYALALAFQLHKALAAGYPELS